jgi:hypothetical protein
MVGRLLAKSKRKNRKLLYKNKGAWGLSKSG